MVCANHPVLPVAIHEVPGLCDRLGAWLVTMGAGDVSDIVLPAVLEKGDRSPVPVCPNGGDWCGAVLLILTTPAGEC